jgi:3-hydroxybutyryl-CoA dehydratase
MSARTLFSSEFDDLRLGQSTSSRGRTITEADIVAFSALSGDWHPQHSDAEWAARSRFGERIAHGMLVLSVAFGLSDFDPDQVIALRRISSATFKAPVKIGDTISLTTKIVSRKAIDEHIGVVGTRWEVANQAGKIVALLTADVLWRRSASSGGPQAEDHGECAPLSAYTSVVTLSGGSGS